MRLTFTFKVLIFFVFLFSTAHKLFASHAMGVDIYYECTGPNTYTFTLDFYRDCDGITPSTSQTLNFSSPSGCGTAFSQTLTLVNVGGTEVSQVCPADLPNTNCNVGGTLPGTEIWTYTGTVTFPTACDDWTYTWSTCCRNSQISNLTSPASQDLFIDGLVNTTVCNNSPQFLSIPTPYICAGQPFCYSLGTFDSENDSLVFSLVQPLDGPAPGTPIPYVAGFTVNEPLSSLVPWTFDPTTGEFCFTPDSAQFGIVKILVEEYRNGILIGTSVRELQVIAQNCTNIQPVFSTPPVTNLTGGVLTAPTVVEVCPGDVVIFDVTATDPNGDNITMNSNVAGAFPTATFTTSCVCPNVTGTFDWAPGVGDVGTHFLAINIQDDGCPILGTQFLNVTIIVLEGTSAGPDQNYCPAGGPVQLNATGGSTFTWSPSTGLSCTTCPDPLASPSVTTTYTVTSDLPATCNNTDQVTVFVVPDFAMDAGPDDTICLNGSTQLNATTDICCGPYTYSWTPTTGLSDPNIANPIAAPTATTTYTVTITSAAGCTQSDILTVTISGVAPLVSATSNRSVVCPGDTTQLDATIPSGGCSDYSVSSIAFSPIGGGGWTSVTLTDDQVSGALSIGFTFEYFCNTYTQFWISSNGWVTFTSTTNSDLSEDPIPTTTVVNNMIALAWDDLYPPGGGAIQYKTIGAAPNRQLVVRFTNINHCCSGTTPTASVQLILYEGTNTIEIHYTDVQNDGGTMTSGIENVDGTLGFPAPGKNQTVWTAVNEAVRFELPPPGGPFTYSWTPAAGLSDPTIANPIATVNATTTYTALVTDVNNTDCSGSAFVTVQIDTTNQVIATPDTSICTSAGTQTIQMNASVTGPAPVGCNTCGANGTSCSNPSSDKTIGTGTTTNSTSTYPAPYGNFYKNAKHQFLYLASELTAEGVNCGTITALGFNISALNTSVTDYRNFQIKMGCTSITSLTTWQSGLSTVFTSKDIGIGTGWNIHAFDFSFDWDGTSNIIVELCFDNRPDAFTQNASTFYTATGFTSAIYYRSDASDACPATTVTTSSNRPNTRFTTCDNPPGAFTYSWTPTTGLSNPNIADPTATVSATTSYIVTVTGGVCTITDTATITYINCGCTPPSPSAVITNVSCFGGANGAIDLTVTGGTTPYTYDWSNGATTQDITGLIAGIYTVTVTESLGCDTIISYTVTDPPALALSILGTGESCAGACNGAADLTVTGGTFPYTYFWSNGETSEDLTGLCAGTYSVTVTDANGCAATASITISIIPGITASFTYNGDQCLTGNSFDFTNTGDLPNSCGMNCPTYSWDFETDGSVDVSGTNTSAANPTGIIYAACGVYTVTLVVDDGICPDTATTIITVFCEPSAVILGTDESCVGACDGAADLTVSGGTPPYLYSWSNGATTQDLTGLCPATYSVTVTDSNGCTATAAVTIAAGVNPVAGFTYNGNQCLTGNSYLFTNTGTSGVTYSWDFGDFVGTSILENPAYTYTSSGVFTVTQVVSIGVCSDTATLNITVFSEPVTSIVGTNESCPGACDGVADLTVTGGTAPYTYLWSNGETTQDLTALCAGTYNVTVTDVNSCIAADTVIIGSNVPILAGFNVNDSGQCLTGNSFDFTNTGIAPNSCGMNCPTYSWDFETDGTIDVSGTDAGAANPSNTYSAVGIYTVTQIVDDGLCVDTFTTAVEVFPEPTASIAGTDVQCNGACDGIADLTPSSGTTPYTYFWSPGGETTQDISSLCPDIYDVTVTDANTCTATASVTITEPPALVVTASGTDITCNGLCDGSATSTVTGGTGPYTYSWNSTPVQTTPSAAGLCAGTYILTVTDANGCIETASVIISEPLLLTVSVTGTDLLCNGVCDGDATATPADGTPPYTYDWDDPGFQTTPTATGLCAGAVTVTITDNNSCTATGSITLTQPPVLSASILGTDEVCAGACDGAGDLTVTGGTGAGTYSYSWSNGPITEDVTGLCAVSYTVTVTDGNSCTTTASVTIASGTAPTAGFTVNDANQCLTGNSFNFTNTGSTGSVMGTPLFNYAWTFTSGSPATSTTEDPTGVTWAATGTFTVQQIVTEVATGCTDTFILTITIFPEPTASIVGTNVSCNGFCDGSANLTASGGIPPYTFLWSNLEITEDITSLCAGTYDVTVTDANGCTVTATAIITEPPALIAGIVGIDASCFGICDGAVDLTVAGGTSPYTHSWSNGDITEDITGLCAGTYTDTITDVNGCTTTASITITEPPVLVVGAAGTDVTCNGLCDGSAASTVSGGTSPYAYSWSPSGGTGPTAINLCAGTYTVTVTDVNGCIDSATVIISEPLVLTTTTTQNNVTCFGACDGDATATLSGGTSPYTYAWDDPGLQTTQTAIGLCAGTYNVVVSDFNSCTDTATLTITEPAVLSASILATNVSCNGACDGAANLTVTGGTAPYTHSWSNGATTEDISALCASTYSDTVTDANGCIIIASITITEPAILIASIVGTNVSCFGACDGAADLTVTGGTAPYTHLWSNGATTEDLTGICAGTYTDTITDVNGCIATAAITISEPAVLSTSIVGTNVSCNGLCDGAANLSVTGGTAPYTFLWSTLATTEDIAGLCAATYSVDVTDNNGCIVSNSVIISEPPLLTSSVIGTNVSCFGVCDGTVDLTVTGGTGSYTHLWSNGATTEDLTALCAGTYTDTITDDNGCITTATITITEPPVLVVGAAGVDVTCNGACDGSAASTVSGGTSPYTYSWSPSGGTGPTAINLCAGTYTVTVTDVNGCIDSATVIISEPPALTTATTQNNGSCFGLCDGDATATPSGGISPYTYSWNDPGLQTTQTASGLCAGTYDVVVTDANGCTDTVTVTITAPPVLSATIAGIDELCPGTCDGSADLTVTGGTGPYTHLWSNGATTEDLITLCAGTYSDTITDANGCTTIASVTIGSGAGPTASFTVNDIDQCLTGNSFDFTNTGSTTPMGAPNFTYDWTFPSGTPATSTTEDPTGITWASTGAFTVQQIVTEIATGCTDTFTLTITIFPEPTASIVGTNVSCFGICDGAADLTVTGGTSPYTNLWSNLATTEDLAGLCAGTYSVTVTDVNLCTATASVTITEPPLLSASVIGTNVSCFGVCDGTTDLTVTGGTGPTTHLWSNGATTEDLTALCAGTYTDTITDDNGCITTATITITEPPVLVVGAAGVDVTCNGACDGSAASTVSGGTSPYTYSWSPSGGTGPTAINLCAGTYTVTVTDVNGCIDSATVI
ncbi:MAG: hypothetical protein FVQ77_12350, partial [Cytophagales bacterium]|nr:hypothetical protein [Cytophagales bacterium]